MSHTHNLKLLFVDDNGNVVEDTFHLHEIKFIFCDPQTHVIDWNGKRGNFTIQWKRKKLDKIQSQFMGDLFSCPIYEKDSIIYQHTQQTIDSIRSKYKIEFHISRLIGDKQTIPDL